MKASRGPGDSVWIPTLRLLLRLTLASRYDVTVRGQVDIARRGRSKILFLPNHPALIDPLILVSHLHRTFAPRVLADADQVNRPIVRWLAREAGVVTIRDVKAYGQEAVDEVTAAREALAQQLRQGGNVLMYPGGALQRSARERLRGTSAAYDLAQAVPDCRIVLVRTLGLWGSCMSMASGEFPDLRKLTPARIAAVFQSYIFGLPRRRVAISLEEPADLPRDAGRQAFNTYLEEFYNSQITPHLYVPYVYGTAPRQARLPEPAARPVERARVSVPKHVRERVDEYLRELTDETDIRKDARLATDLGLDSLARADLLLWLNREFGQRLEDAEALETVDDVLQAACGVATGQREEQVPEPPKAWTRTTSDRALEFPDGDTIGAVFLNNARRHLGRYALADQRSGAIKYRRLLTALHILVPAIEKLPGERVGIMLPASVGATTAYLACLFAGKTPVMVNWTTGVRNVRFILELTGAERILTARQVVSQLAHQDAQLSELDDYFVMLDDIRERVGKMQKLKAAVEAALGGRRLDPSRMPETAVILMTSGSETRPKAVPLTHANILANIRDVLKVFALYESDRLLGFLPAFHSFGLTVTSILPVLLGVPTVYYPKPTEAAMLARFIRQYRVTMLLGTPTFLGAILRAATSPEALESLRLAITGAEKCPQHVYDALARKCPQAIVGEGYGVTECSPIISVNPPEKPREGTIGKVLPSYEYTLTHPETGETVARGERGIVLVRGPSVFNGYWSEDFKPFVEHDGKEWYRTGDLVREDDDGTLTFEGRLKRFVKIGGEMVSLPAIESTLQPHFTDEDDEGPQIAIVAHEAEGQPQIVMFTTKPAERSEVNRLLREAGLSPIHNVAEVREIDEIPLLGTGKANYKQLEGRLDESESES